MKIDTSTTAGKIQVMQAFEDGKKIEGACESGWLHITGGTPTWNWSAGNYRIKPQTVEDAYDAYMRGIEFLDTQSSFIAGAEWQKEQDNE